MKTFLRIAIATTFLIGSMYIVYSINVAIKSGTKYVDTVEGNIG